MKKEYENAAVKAQEQNAHMEGIIEQANSHFTYMGSVINALQTKHNSLHAEMQTHEHTTVLLNASVQQKDEEAKRLADELTNTNAELIATSTSYNNIAGDYNQARKDCSYYKEKVDAYVQQLDQLRVEVDRLERQAHEQARKYAGASQADGQRS